MSTNDKDLNIAGNKGVDVYPGVMNSTSSSDQSNPMANNFVDDPTSDEVGAGAGGDFRGGRDAKASIRAGAGVVEARPGIIESSHVAPLEDDTVKAANLE